MVSLILQYLRIIKSGIFEDYFQILTHIIGHVLVHGYTTVYIDTQQSLKEYCCKFPFTELFNSVFQCVNLWVHKWCKEFGFTHLPIVLNFSGYNVLCLLSSTLKTESGKAHTAVAGTAFALHCKTECYQLVIVAFNLLLLFI